MQASENGHSWLVLDKDILMENPKKFWAKNSTSIPIVIGKSYSEVLSFLEVKQEVSLSYAIFSLFLKWAPQKGVNLLFSIFRDLLTKINLELLNRTEQASKQVAARAILPIRR